MDLPIEHAAFAGHGLTLRTGGFSKGQRLLVDGAEAKAKRLEFELRDNSRNTHEVRLRSNGLDPLDRLAIGRGGRWRIASRDPVPNWGTLSVFRLLDFLLRSEFVGANR